MFYTVYKVTNTINRKIYIGVHKTDDLNDEYMGSGKLIKAAIKKYGIENFSKEYLQVFDNAEDMFDMESQLVNEEFVQRDDTYNLKIGGAGGWEYINSAGLNTINTNPIPGNNAFLERFNNDPEFKELVINKLIVTSKLGRDAQRDLYPNGLFFGKKHSEETKSVMSEKAKLRTGEKSSGFGSMWITNGTESKKIKKDDMIPDGWRKGRVQK